MRDAVLISPRNAIALHDALLCPEDHVFSRQDTGGRCPLCASEDTVPVAQFLGLIVTPKDPKWLITRLQFPEEAA